MFRLDRVYRPLPLGAVHNVAVTLSRSCSVVVMGFVRALMTVICADGTHIETVNPRR